LAAAHRANPNALDLREINPGLQVHLDVPEVVPELLALEDGQPREPRGDRRQLDVVVDRPSLMLFEG